MTGKGAEDLKEYFAKLIVQAVKQIKDNNKIDLDNIKIEKLSGGSIKDTELIAGLVIDKEKISIDMPSHVHNAKIALIDFPIEIKSLDIDTKISLTSPDQYQMFIQQEENIIRSMVDKIRNSGANVVFCQKGIDDLAQYFFAKSGIYACRRVAKSDLEKISMATKARIISNINELSMSELGYAQLVEEIKHGDDILTYIRGCQNPKAVTLLIHGGTSHVIDEIERAIKDGLGDVSSVLKNGFIVPGGGAIEIELARRLREYGQSLNGREQLAVEEFASALEFIPITLAENAGMDPIDILTELKYKHENGEKNAGLNLFTNSIEDTLQAGIVEPLKIKTQAIDSATEVSTMILRIDDVIAANSKKDSKSPKFGNPYEELG
jgi:chaperonin GroEL (HSP60 family)